jgi:hypothetical protein
MTIRHQFLENSLALLQSQRRLADRAIAQLTNAQLHEIPHAGGNSIDVLMKHLGGNMRSRWTGFLTSDGEKSGRNRDGEFIDDFKSRPDLDAYWEGGWACVFDAVGGLHPEDLERSVTIRGTSLGVLAAIQRQISHYAYHVGQIVLQARTLAGTEWKSLSIPRGESETFNRAQGQESA